MICRDAHRNTMGVSYKKGIATTRSKRDTHNIVKVASNN